MNKFAFFLLACAATSAWAQPAEVTAQRAHIAAERSRAEAEFELAHKACYQKFAVNDCISDARARLRQVLADLRQQELALNDAERRRRAAERMREIESRSAGREPAAGQEQQQQQRAQQETPQEPQQATQQRGPRVRETAKAAAPQRAASAQAPKPRRAAQAPRTPKPVERPDTEENERRYNERLQQAQEHKAKVEKRAAESGNKDVKPLPVPP